MTGGAPRGHGPGDALAFLRVRELSWLDLVLPQATLEALQALAARASDGALVAVVSGERGVGKTVAVQTCAEQLRLDTWRLDCRLLVARHGEATPAALPAVVAAAERPHALLLCHDAEWLFEPSAAGAGEALLQLAADRQPPTVLETRQPELVASRPALAGTPHVALPFPDVAARAELWRRLAWRAHPLLEPDVEALAAEAAPGALIEQALELALDRSSGPELPSPGQLRQALREIARSGA